MNKKHNSKKHRLTGFLTLKCLIIIVVAIFSLRFFFTNSLIVYANDVFGNITPPKGVERFVVDGGNPDIGIVPFVSSLLRVFTIVAGIWVMVNFIMAGFMYVTSSGDSGVITKATSKMSMSVIGLIIMIASYTITAIISLIIFNDAGFILKPVLTGAGG